jgi:hypothetical protein
VRIGGGGAYQPQFTHHMYLPVDPEAPEDAPPPAPFLVDAVAPAPPPPGPDPAEAAPPPPPPDAAPAEGVQDESPAPPEAT